MKTEVSKENNRCIKRTSTEGYETVRKNSDYGDHERSVFVAAVLKMSVCSKQHKCRRLWLVQRPQAGYTITITRLLFSPLPKFVSLCWLAAFLIKQFGHVVRSTGADGNKPLAIKAAPEFHVYRP